MSPARWLAFVALLAALVVTGASMLDSRAEARRSEQAFASAEIALDQGNTAHAAAIARDILAREPSQGRAFGLIARAEDGEEALGPRLARLGTAARRSPRDVGVRGRLATVALQSGDFTAAVAHLDSLLTIAPAQRGELFKLIIELSQDPAFATAMAGHLAAQPRWRASVLRAASASGLPEASDALHGALGTHGALSADETTRWIEGMLREGRWGAAYARWASGLGDAPQTLSAPWNGNFRRAPSSSGFDWRVGKVPGVLFDRIGIGGDARAARLRFLGRPVERVGLEVPLLLGPGEHVLRMRVRTADLRADQGLEWVLACGDGRTPIARGARIREARGWVLTELPFNVPDSPGCQGQWLRLVNPAPRGVAQILRGELHITDVTVGK